MAFNNEVRTALDTDKRQREESSRSTLQKIGLYLKRTIIWIIVLTLIFFFVVLILYLYNNVQEMSNKDCGLKVELQSNEGSQRFHNHKEGPYKDFLLVESSY